MKQAPRAFWTGLLLAIITLGILSRVIQTGSRILDKYLGDALYAAMVYAILRLTGRISRVALWSALILTGVELFQLTGVAARMLRGNSIAANLCARLMGTDFSMLDLLAYAVGIACIATVDRARSLQP